MKIKWKGIISAVVIIVVVGIFLFSQEERKMVMSTIKTSIFQELDQGAGNIVQKLTKEMLNFKISDKEVDERAEESTMKIDEVQEINEAKIIGEDIHLPEMEWSFFLETEISYGSATYSYYRYGVYGDFIKNRKEGEKAYFSLQESVLRQLPDLASQINWEEIDEEYENHEKWIMCEEELLTDCSGDLEWIVTRDGKGIERWYREGNKVKEFPVKLGRNFIQQENGDKFVPLEEEKIVKAQEILQGLYYGYGKEKAAGIGEYYRSLSCFSSSGKVMAAVNNFVWYRPDGINIYSLEEGTEVLLYQLPVPTTEAGWPIGIWQMKGDQSSGWVVFSYGKDTYRMTYPDGKIEKIGEFMFCTSYSPDEKYLAYCTGNRDLEDHWMWLDEAGYEKYYSPLEEEWDKIPQGWYVIELETGEKSYIPVPVWTYDADRPLHGGRCTWIEKDKLKVMLEM